MSKKDKDYISDWKWMAKFQLDSKIIRIFLKTNSNLNERILKYISKTKFSSKGANHHYGYNSN